MRQLPFALVRVRARGVCLIDRSSELRELFYTMGWSQGSDGDRTGRGEWGQPTFVFVSQDSDGPPLPPAAPASRQHGEMERLDLWRHGPQIGSREHVGGAGQPVSSGPPLSLPPLFPPRLTVLPSLDVDGEARVFATSFSAAATGRLTPCTPHFTLTQFLRGLGPHRRRLRRRQCRHRHRPPYGHWLSPLPP